MDHRNMIFQTVFAVIVAVICVHTITAEDPVVFSLGQNADVYLTNATTIPYTKTITNHNAIESINGGVFTCELAGLYKFQVYAMTKSNANLYLELYQNTDLVASLWAHTPADYSSAGNAVILNMATGDTVQVISRSNETVNLYGTDQEIYTTFTGVQLSSLQQGEGQQPTSAFSVTLNQHQDVAGGSSVLYNTILTDENGAYDNNTGVYKAPSGGIYIFHFFSLAEQNQVLWQELYHNGDYVCSIYGLTTNEWADAGNTAILHLKAGDNVTVKARSGKLNSIFGTDDQIYSSFSGAQIASEQNIANLNTDKVVAFSVGLSKGYTVTADDKVIFDRIFIDLGHTYNHMTGEFIAPMSGIYEFNYHALGQSNSKIYLELYHNYHYVDSLYSHTPSHYAAAGNSAAVELDAGDVVFVKAHHNNDLYGKSDQVYCTFSGYLLHSTNQPDIIIGK